MFAVPRVFAALLSLSVLAHTAGAEPKSFRIEAQDAVTALTEFARQANRQILFQSDRVKGFRTNAVAGRYEPADAMALLLKDTGLRAWTREGDVLVIDLDSAGNAAVSGATRSAEPAQPVMKLAEANSSERDGGPSVPSPQSEAAGPQTASASAKDITEITVTATKRAERLQDVPISIGVVTAEEIDRRGFLHSADYLRGIPSANQVESWRGQGIVIRGLETTLAYQNAYAGTTTATYFGETPTTNSGGTQSVSSVDIKLVDIERVEVLRGPQGTAFGSSSLGGAVRVIPVAPKLDEFEGKVSAGYSNTARQGGGNYVLQAIANLPVIEEKLAMRAALYEFEESGFYRGIAGSDPSVQAAAAGFGVPAGHVIDQDDVGDSRASGARLSALFQATEDLRLTLTYLTQKTESDGVMLANRPGYDQALLQVPPSHVRRGQGGGMSDSHINLVNAVLEYDLGWADLLATHSRTRGGVEYVANLSAEPQFPDGFGFSLWSKSGNRARVSEVRLATKLEGPLNGLIGLYTENQDDESDPANEGIWYGDVARNPWAPGYRELLLSRRYRDLTQKAAFGELSWEPIARLTLTGGFRFYDYARDARTESSGRLTGPGDFDAVRVVIGQVNASGSTFRGNVSYKLTEESLLYAGYSEGFRLGSPQNGLPAAACDRNNDGLNDGTNVTMQSLLETTSDTVESYEFGAKASLFDRRLQVSAAVFRIDWNGIPVSVASPAPPVGCAFLYVTNAGVARSEGVELELNAQLSEAVRLNAGLSSIHARLTKDAPDLGAPAGTRLPGSPAFNANMGVEYGFALGARDAVVRADAVYVGPFYGNLVRTPTLRAGDYVKVDLSARMRLNESITFDLYARNLLNADDYTFRGITNGPNAAYGWRLRPRTIGIQLAYDF